VKRGLIALIVVLVTLTVATMQVSALKYEDQPNVTAYISGTNHLVRGTQTIYLTVYNPAERKKVDYFEVEEAQFFSGREDMLFTAYNVELKLEGNDYIEVKTPQQKIPALPPFKPINLPFVVEVKDEAKAGKYELKLKVSFDVIDDLVNVETFYPPTQSWAYYQKQEVVGGNTTIIYKYHPITEYYKLRYKRLSFEIPIEVYVEEKSVRLEIVNVSAENMVGNSKGKIVIWVKNVGEKVGKNAYLVLETPSGFTASALSMSQPTMTTSATLMQMPSAMPSAMSMPSAMPSMQPTMPSTMSQPSQPAYYVGDLMPGEIAKAVFYVKINTKDEGNYTFKVKAVYLDEYGKTVTSDPVPFGVHIAKAPELEVKSVESHVFVNAKGKVVVTLTPTSDMKDVTVYLITNPPLSVLSSEYYLGDVEAGKTYTAVFKVEASDSAEPVTYSAQIKAKYKSLDEYFETDPITVGIKVNPKMRFEVYGIPKIQAGREAVVEWTIKNVGNFTIREATARLTIIDPFSSSDDTAYIGTLKPGETATVKFKLKVDGDATPKLYGLNLEVKYKDAEGEWAISEPVKAVVEVTPAKGFSLIGILVVVVVAGIVILIYRRRKK